MFFSDLWPCDVWCGDVGGLSVEASRLFRVRKTCCKMLSNRGYAVPDEHINMTTEEFKYNYGGEDGEPSRANLRMLVEKEDDETEQVSES